WEEDEDPERNLLKLYASILVEREGQKKIVVGRQGQMIKNIGTAARLDLEDYLGRRVFLDLHVKVEPDWRENRALLADLSRDVDLGGLE
ncbi:MAG TPA: KH domain-containing protein, partial [Thermoanaerobaculia bacterium]|nr:KH domain-containing protein [Thermoanaerobaculia bacterium]